MTSRISSGVASMTTSRESLIAMSATLSSRPDQQGLSHFSMNLRRSPAGGSIDSWPSKPRPHCRPSPTRQTGARPHRRDERGARAARHRAVRRDRRSGQAQAAARYGVPRPVVSGTGDPGRRHVVGGHHRRRVPRAHQGGRRRVRHPQADRRAVGRTSPNRHHLRAAGRGTRGAGQGRRRRRGTTRSPPRCRRRGGSGSPTAALSLGAPQGGAGRHHDAHATPIWSSARGW